MQSNRICSARPARGLVLALLATLAAGVVAGEATAKGKSIQTEANWVKFDPATKTVTAKIVKTGSRPKDKEASLSKGKEATFDVKPEGTILTRTSVKINGRKGELTDIPEGKRVLIYWIEDPAMSTKRFARTIDVTLSEEELNERFELE